MLIAISRQLPGSAQDAAQVLFDPGFPRTWLSQLGATAEHVEIDRLDDGTVQSVLRTALPTDVIPPSIRAVLPASIELRRATVWNPPSPDGSRRGTVVVEIVGAPVRMLATTSLVQAAEVSYRVRGDLKVRVPLVGASVEAAVTPVVTSVFDAEADALAKSLA